jgi:hypothetical protein
MTMSIINIKHCWLTYVLRERIEMLGNAIVWSAARRNTAPPARPLADTAMIAPDNTSTRRLADWLPS